ncbi:MAG: response regulator [Mesorhizobium sp.]|nr:response regulator [Mesorhizobium sp.]MBL8575605.1 response regulator [Mesorhizobium sp.]
MYNPIKVLVVEDEPLVLMDISDQLQAHGFDVIEASSADEALVHLSTHSDIAVIFTDVDMPGTMNGLKLAAAVRERWPPIKIIVTSGHHILPNDYGLPEGSRFFPKPYGVDAVTRAMRELMET